MLTGARDPEAAAWALARDGREVVITLGKDGALWSDGERVERARASPAPAPVDSTGAGDAFTAGWLAARLRGRGADRGAGGRELRRRAGAAGAPARAEGEISKGRRGRPVAAALRRLRPRAGRAEDLDPVLGGDAAEDLRRQLSSAATAITKRSKPDGALETSVRAPSGPTS